MGRKTFTLLCAAAVALAFSLPLAFAGSRAQAAAGAGSCTVTGNTVEATGLPTDALINFMVSNANGTYGWALGFTWEGTWSLSVPNRTSETTYTFASTTWGKNGSKYLAYASCSAS